VPTSRGIRLQQSNGLSIDGPSGIGGWLVFPVLGMILTSLITVFALFRDVIPVFRPQIWSALTTPGSPAYNALWAPLTFFEAMAMLVMIAMPVVLLVLIFQKRRVLPRMMLCFLCFAFAVGVVDSAAVLYLRTNVFHETGPDARVQVFQTVARGALGLAIWVPYFLKSKRVKNTFVN
jgi:hypothetical protein